MVYGRPKLYLFAWKLLRNMLPTGDKLRKLRMNIDGDCPFCNKVEENIDHIFSTHGLANIVWCIIENYCQLLLTLINGLLIGLNIYGIINLVQKKNLH